MSISSAVRRIATATALVAAIVIPSAAPSQAQTAYASDVSTLMTGATCNYVQHTLVTDSHVVLAGRYSSGAWVVIRYYYWYVNTANQPISAGQYTGWQRSFVQASIRQDDILVVPQALPGIALRAVGHLKTLAQIGVWNGSAWEYSGWASPDEYTNQGPYGAARASSCWASALA